MYQQIYELSVWYFSTLNTVNWVKRFLFNETQGKTKGINNSVQEFAKIESWLLIIRDSVPVRKMHGCY